MRRWPATSIRTCRLHGEFRLRSGRVVAEYSDKYLFESQPELLRRVAEAMVPLVPEGTELLGGLELGGVPIATMVSSLTGMPALFVRKKATRTSRTVCATSFR